MFESTRRRVLQGLGLGGTAAVAGCSSEVQTETETISRTPKASRQAKQVVDQVAADPTDIPAPIDRDEPTTHEVELEAKEVRAEIEDGVTFNFMTFDGQIPGPMIRVRQGDRVEFTLKNAPENNMPHNVDMHAIYGTGGGSVATTAAPGEENAEVFTARYPGAYIYHCAVPNLDYHISAGMFGMILVEPKEGLPEVDREFYFGQHEVYTDSKQGSEGHHGFDMKRMAQEDPTYVLLNGEKFGYAAANHGPLEAKQGERVRVFFVDGGPNLSSNFHPIGNVWSDAYRDGALASAPEKFVQTMKVPPGSCMVGEMDTPVPERIKLVDHALSRVVRKGALAEIDVTGTENPETFDPSPDKPASADEEGPLY
ncbi:copper-containing nitrite reductase [Halorarius litoreus]|uniref:copper-containing nitrite reductase n=1 Tax=Halorarius litoreus TaxID=2962676 RepID=UPI0020CE4F33|nr:copper-containing nitrite reductase [Halorarius litoreus]